MRIPVGVFGNFSGTENFLGNRRSRYVTYSGIFDPVSYRMHENNIDGCEMILISIPPYSMACLRHWHHGTPAGHRPTAFLISPQSVLSWSPPHILIQPSIVGSFYTFLTVWNRFVVRRVTVPPRVERNQRGGRRRGRDERLPKNFPGNPRFHYVAYQPYPGIIDPASGENNIDGCQLDDPDINTAIGHTALRTCVPASRRRRPPAPAGLPCRVCYLPS